MLVDIEEVQGTLIMESSAILPHWGKCKGMSKISWDSLHNHMLLIQEVCMLTTKAIMRWVLQIQVSQSIIKKCLEINMQE